MRRAQWQMDEDPYALPVPVEDSSLTRYFGQADSITMRLPSNFSAQQRQGMDNLMAVLRSCCPPLVKSHDPHLLNIDDALLKEELDENNKKKAEAEKEITDALTSHPGTLHSLRLVSTSFAGCSSLVAKWLSLAAKKRVEHLFLVNHPLPVDFALPVGFVEAAGHLKTLHVGLCKFPDTSKLPPAAFAELRELGLLCADMEKDDQFESLLARCTRLEKLLVACSCKAPRRIRVASESLRQVALWMALVDDVVVVNAPALERIIIEPFMIPGLVVKIGSAPRLSAIGYLDLQFHGLLIRGNVIQANSRGLGTAMPSVKTLAVKLHFGDMKQVMMLPALLHCFPCLERLHIRSKEDSSSKDTVTTDPMFWKKIEAVECVGSSLKKVHIEGYRGEAGEAGFVMFVLANAKVLEVLQIGTPAKAPESLIKKQMDVLQLGARMQRDKSLGAQISVNKRDAAKPCFWGPLACSLATDLSRPDPFDLQL